MVDLALLSAGLQSHGFTAAESPAEDLAGSQPVRFVRLGREDRWLHADGSITIEGIGIIPPGSDYHKLLEKCGAIWLRTRERYPAIRSRVEVDADHLLDLL